MCIINCVNQCCLLLLIMWPSQLLNLFVLSSRCHQNDLENIIPFVIVGLLYALTGPELSVALLHFRIFAGARIFHTIAYIGALPQPSRGLSWVLGMLVTFSMAYRVLNTVLFLQKTCLPIELTFLKTYARVYFSLAASICELDK